MRRFFATTIASTSLFLLSGAVGCGSAPEGEGETSTAAQALYSKNADIPMNGLPTRVLVRNLLSTNAANARELVQSPLSTATFTTHPNLAQAIAMEPGTLDFLRYVVACALTSDQAIDAGGMHMPGSVGVCPEWANGAASTDCQERVSACLLLMNNPNGVTVPLSVHGPATGGSVALRPRLAPATVAAAETGYWAPTLASFQPCPVGTYGASTDCGWNPSDSMRGWVGECDPGSTVHVGTGGCGLGSSTGDTVLRVCDGARGCDSTSPSLLATNDDACGTLQSYVTFTCRADGAFNVMVTGYDRSASLTPTIAATEDAPPIGSRFAYPVSEAQHFRVREGAFFGNIFVGLAASYVWDGQTQSIILDPSFPSNPNAFGPYPMMYACNEPGTTATATMNRRTCASDGGPLPCAAQAVGACPSMCTPMTSPPWSTYGAYGACTAGGRTWTGPETSYLHSRFDVLSPNCGCF